VKRIALLLLAVAVSAVTLAAFPLPWPPVLLLWLVIVFRAARRTGSRFLRYGAGVLLALFLFEGGITAAALLTSDWASPALRQEGDYTEGYFVPDDLLGYRPPAGRRVTSRKLYGDEALYDVVYTIDEHGLRSAGPAPAEAAGCLFFFGGSLTFGEGLDDADSIPYQVGSRLGGRYRVYNFGFHGYGPHQMLAELERGTRAAELARACPGPVTFFALYTNGHASRSSGRSVWDTHGPRYVLTGHGGVAYTGSFDRAIPRPVRVARMLLARSLAVRILFFERALGEEEVALLRAIVVQAAQAAREIAPGSAFHLIYLDAVDDPEAMRFDRAETERAFGEAGIPVDFLSDIVPDYREAIDRYTISRHDRHFNAAATARVAARVAEIVRSGELR